MKKHALLVLVWFKFYTASAQVPGDTILIKTFSYGSTSRNTFIVDSTKIDNAPKITPDHLILNFTGTAYPYSTSPLYDYYDFAQTNVVLN